MKGRGGAPLGNKNRVKDYEGPQYAWVTDGTQENFAYVDDLEFLLTQGWRRGRLAGKAGYKGRKLIGKRPSRHASTA